MGKIGTSIIAAGLMVFYLSSSQAFGCNVCHSKNPRMVKMHAELEYKNCLSCHGRGQVGPKSELPRQMKEDPLCTRCHNK